MINKFKTLLNYLTLILLLTLALYRYRIRIPREIFENPTLVYLVVYIYIVVLNIILFVCVYLKFRNYEINVNNSTRFLTVVTRINWWIDYSYKKFMDYIASIPGYFSEILATMTHYFIKIPPIFFRNINYALKLGLILALTYDILIQEKFMYFYYLLYLLLIPLITKAILYILTEVNERILQEYYDSVIIIDFTEAYKNSNNLNETYFELSEHNKQFTSVKQALSIGNLVLAELDKLNLIKQHLQEAYKFQLFTRLCYILLFSYIVYFYPINLFTPL